MFGVMRTGVRLVMTNPADPGRVEDYAAWYDDYGAALTGPGFLANAFRFENSAAAGTEDDPRFVAVYDIVTPDPATAFNDMERLQAGELVYTGALRTNLAAIAPRVPVRGGWCPVASEQFAISADVHLVLGHLTEAAYDCPTPDGRPATVSFARERIARLVCSDTDQLQAREIDAIAAFLAAEQVRQIEAAARTVQRPLPREAPVVAVGSGEFLA